jgi:acyl carrier protein phosphodiesterase
MNFLAHSYLSFNRPDILIGNMISDFVKGKKKYDYAPGVLVGINLHRDIDNFTDAHDATREAKEFLKPAVGLYAGAFIDVVYDHFLANDDKEFSNESLQQHTKDTYKHLYAFRATLPDTFRLMLPYMQAQDWLYNYRNIPGTKSSFGGVVRRAKYLDSSAAVFELFEKHYSSLQNCYNAFFPSVKAFAIHQIEQL